MGDVIDSIQRHKRLIGIISVVAAITGAIFYLAGPKKYEGKTEFVVRNPNYADRNNIYNYDTRYMDYFANEDDIDKVILMSEAQIVQGRVIKNLHLAVNGIQSNYIHSGIFSTFAGPCAFSAIASSSLMR